MRQGREDIGSSLTEYSGPVNGQNEAENSHKISHREHFSNQPREFWGVLRISLSLSLSLFLSPCHKLDLKSREMLMSSVLCRKERSKYFQISPIESSKRPWNWDKDFWWTFLILNSNSFLETSFIIVIYKFKFNRDTNILYEIVYMTIFLFVFKENPIRTNVLSRHDLSGRVSSHQWYQHK